MSIARICAALQRANLWKATRLDVNLKRRSTSDDGFAVFPPRRLLTAIFLCASLLLSALCESANAQGTPTNGWTHTGTIAPVADSDSWTFSASIGDRIVIRVGEISQTNTFTPRIRLQSPSAVQIGLASGALVAEITVTATNTGTFTVIVDDNVGTTATGTYRLTLAKSPGEVFVAPGDEGGPMTNGVTYEGNYLPPGDLDVWNFTATTGDSVALKLGQLTDTNSFDPWIRLYGPDGTLVGSSFDFATAEVSLQTTNSGTFQVVVANNPYNNAAGNGTYRLTLAKTGSAVAVASGDEGGQLTNGFAYTGNLPIGDLDAWNFTANIGEAIVVKMGQISDTNSFDPWVRLYGPNGVLIGSSFGFAAAEVTTRATNSGTFLVVIGNNPYNNDAGSGTYLLKLAKTGSTVIVAAGDEGGALTNGVANSCNMPIGDLDVWSFPANLGDSMVVKAGQITDASNFDPWVRLYGPDGALLGSSFGAAAAEVTVRATNNGTFLVVIANNPYNSDAGNGTYLLTLAKTGEPFVVSPGDEGGSLTNGAASFGNMPVGDLDLWNFTASSGQSMVLRVGQISETNNFAPWVRLYGPNGELVGSDWAAAVGEVTFRATNSGTYLVVIANYLYYSDAGSGTYVLTLAKTGSPVVVSPGDEGGSLVGSGTYNGNLPVGEMDLWTFTICPGERIAVRVDEITQTNNFAPWFRLYGPNGVLIGSTFGATFAQLALTTTNSGSFLLAIANNDYYNNAGSGTYQMTVNGLSDGFKLCIPVVAGTTVGLGGVGGISNATFILFTHTNVATPLASWLPILTNQFDQYGAFRRTNAFDRAEPERYYRLLQLGP